jgi:thioredoxin-like negative regulator of GroEL
LESGGCYLVSPEEPIMSALSEVTDATFESKVLKSARPAIVDFWAEW